MSIDRARIEERATARTKPFKMTRQSMIEEGCVEEYEGFRALGLHECANCHTDIPETFEYDCMAYPVPNTSGRGISSVHDTAFLCGRCYDLRIKDKKIEVSENTLIWLLSGDTGRSSLTMCSCLYLIPTKNDLRNYPHDPGDFGRCKRFLETLTPDERKTALLNVSAVSKQWKRLVENWDRLDKLYDADKSKLFEEMQKLKGVK